LVLALAAFMAAAREPSFSGALTGRLQMPGQQEIATAQARAREAMRRVPEADAEAKAIPGMPRVEAMPRPAVPAPDIASIAEKYRDLGRTAVAQYHTPDLLVLVSLSMPREGLQHLIDQAEKAGAKLVFRGLKGDSMTKMGEEIKAIVGNRNVSVAIHPPAFQQFNVSRVPAVILARGEAGRVLESGCSKAETFVKVTGDVSLEYALEYIERRSPAWAEVARSYRSRIVRGIN
jgi:conjugal transfer pilus assembly protein TrbC